MPVEFQFNFPLPNGLHARPASHFEAVASRFDSRITLRHQGSGYKADARSVLSLISADVKQNDRCEIQIAGKDEQTALIAIQQFVRDQLPHCDEALPAIASDTAQAPLPRSLVAAGVKQAVRGRSVSGGIGRGKALLLSGMVIPPGIEGQTSADPDAQHRAARTALVAVSAGIESKIQTAKTARVSLQSEVQVLTAHAAILRDPALVDLIHDRITTAHRTAAAAIVDACKSFSQTLSKSSSAYLRERVLDVQDVCMQLLAEVLGAPVGNTAPLLTTPTVIFAEHLTPGQMLSLDRNYLAGLVLSDGGTTSHTVILARSMNVPTLVGVARSPAIMDAAEVIVDGESGLVVIESSESIHRYYQLETDRISAKREQAAAFTDLPGTTADGRGIEIAANIASAAESTMAFQSGAQAVGLFRTEMLFTGRDSAPTELEQTEIYADAVRAGNGKPVIIRLLDIGGDKPVPYLNLPEEENPFLGFRGVRLYEQFAPMLKGQLRAILQASNLGPVKIMVPMICCIEEVQMIKQMLADARKELSYQGFTVQKMPELGAMIEVPSVAFIIPELCRELDFFSIGSNDLTQYVLAADRGNAKVSNLYTWSHPAFLRMLKSIVDQVHTHGKWIGLCGEMGDQPAALPLLVGLGLDEISVSVPRVCETKSAVAKLSFARCRKLLVQACECSTRGQVDSVLAGASTGSSQAVETSLIASDLIFASDATSKEEVIKQLCDRLDIAGRTAKPKLLEEAIWAREDVYSTGFGYGFAVPHCKSDHLSASSIVIAKLSHPIEWKSLDGKPVEVVMLLAIRSDNHAQQHMRIIAKLSRLVMRDEFRERLLLEQDPARLAKFLQQSIDG